MKNVFAILSLFTSLFNPVPERPSFNEDFPDPAVIRTQDGTTYLYGTQGIVGGHIQNIRVIRSRDQKSWERLDDALPVKPVWAKTTQKFWAPHVIEMNQRFYMYYSAEPNDHSGLCLAVATSKKPEGPFEDMGHPLKCGEGFQNIDPMVYLDSASNRKFMIWGSGFEPIRIQELTADGFSFAPNTAPISLIKPRPASDPLNYQRLVEGAWIIQAEGYYFLFFSGDNCCGSSPHYALMVARSKNLAGPYEVWIDPKTGYAAPILQADQIWTGPGHNSVLQSGPNQFVVFYHAIERSNPRLKDFIPGDRFVRRVLLQSQMKIVNGWPVLTNIQSR
jgi:arabinan endo-1,5-alpha-L-arabinosidase